MKEGNVNGENNFQKQYKFRTILLSVRSIKFLNIDELIN